MGYFQRKSYLYRWTSVHGNQFQGQVDEISSPAYDEGLGNQELANKR